MKTVRINLLTCVAIAAFGKSACADEVKPISITAVYESGKIVVDNRYTFTNIIHFHDACFAMPQYKTSERQFNLIFALKTTFEEMMNLSGLVQLKGAKRIRYFVMSSDRTQMAEIMYDRPVIPFSLNPKVTDPLSAISEMVRPATNVARLPSQSARPGDGKKKP